MDESKKEMKPSDVIKIDDSPLSFFFVARVANRLLPYAEKKGYSPNHVTAASLILGVMAALLYANGARVLALAGSAILIVGFVLDCLDGQLARYTGKTTAFGYWLDIFGDRIRELFLWICLCVGTSKSTGQNEIWMWGMLAAIALSLRFAEGLYREKALGNSGQPATVGNAKKINIRVWTQRLFYFSIAERTFLLAIVAPLGMAELFFKIMIIGNIAMMMVFSANGWWKASEGAFGNAPKGN